jgi:hypothetical protein
LTGFQDSLRRRPGPAQDRRVSRRRSRCAGRIAPSDAWGNDGERRAPMSRAQRARGVPVLRARI